MAADTAVPWLVAAHKDIGQRETLGPNDSPRIRAMLTRRKAMWLLGQPWCGTAMADWMDTAGQALPKHWYRAMAWREWGVALKAPVVGCVVVFARKGGGHVGIVVGIDKRGRLMVLGANQGNACNIAPFAAGREATFHWPAGYPLPAAAALPLIASSAASSTNEA